MTQKILVIRGNNGERELIERKTYPTYSELPKESSEGVVEYVESTTGLIGFRKFKGWYVRENGSWTLLHRDKEGENT